MQLNAQIETLLAALLFTTIFIFGWRLDRARTPRAVLSLDIVWNRSRNTIDEPLTSTDHSIELTMKRVW